MLLQLFLILQYSLFNSAANPEQIVCWVAENWKIEFSVKVLSQLFDLIPHIATPQASNLPTMPKLLLELLLDVLELLLNLLQDPSNNFGRDRKSVV